jgi:hypothetical protein
MSPSAALLPLAVLLIGCKHDDRPAPALPAPPAIAPEAPPPPPQPARGVPAEAPTPDMKAALAWLDALRERDPGAVREKSALPFDFRDSRAKAPAKKCRSRVAADKKAVAAVATCVATDARFHTDLSATPEPRIVPLDAGSLPPWAQPWAKTLRPGLRLVSTFVHGEDEARELVLLVADDGVHGLWQKVTVEPVR